MPQKLNIRNLFLCDLLKELVVPDSVTKINADAFIHYKSFEIVTNNPVAIKYAEDHGIPYRKAEKTASVPESASQPAQRRAGLLPMPAAAKLYAVIGYLLTRWAADGAEA